MRRAVSSVTQDSVTVPPAAVEILPIEVDEAARRDLVKVVVGQPMVISPDDI